MSANLFIKKFDMSKIDKRSAVAIIGKRNIGKSYLVKDLLYYNHDIPFGTVISPCESEDQFYGNIVPNKFIHNEFNEEIVNNLAKRQKLVINKINQQKDQFGKTNIDPFAYLICDSLMQDWLKNSTMREFFASL